MTGPAALGPYLLSTRSGAPTPGEVARGLRAALPALPAADLYHTSEDTGAQGPGDGRPWAGLVLAPAPARVTRRLQRPGVLPVLLDTAQYRLLRRIRDNRIPVWFFLAAVGLLPESAARSTSPAPGTLGALYHVRLLRTPG